MRYLERPYPREWNLTPIFIFKVSSFIGLFVFLFLYIFQPDNLIGTSNAFALFPCFIYGLIGSVIPSLSLIFTPRLFPNYCNEEKWNIKKEFTLNISIVILIAIFVNIFGFNYLEIDFDWFKLFKIVTLVFLVSLIPVLGLISFNQNRWLKQYIASSEEINETIEHSKPHLPHVNSNEVIIEGQGKNERVRLNVDDVLFISSQGNYCEIIRVINGKIKKDLIRISIANIEEQLKSFEVIEKVHRSFIVNLENVRNVNGNAQGYKLYFEHTKTVVPVSRNKSKEIKSKLIALSK